MKFKKIIYSSDVDLSLPNGPGVNEREFVESIDRLFDGDFCVLVPRIKNEIPDLIRKFSNKKRKLEFFWRKTNNPLIYLIKQIHVFLRLRRLMENRGNSAHTIFVFRVIVFPLAYLLFVRLYRPRYALRICGDGMFPFLDNNMFYKIVLKPINRSIMSYLYKNAVGCDAVTEAHVNSLKSNYKGTFFKVDNGVNIERFIPATKNREFLKGIGLQVTDFIVGYTGNFPHIRGGDEIIEAFKFLKQRNRLRFKAIIAGDDGGVDLLKAKILKYELQNHIKLIGKVDFLYMPLIVSQLDLGVSFLGMEYRGASEQKVRQYLACGVPAVVSPGGSSFVEYYGIGKVIDHLEGIETVAQAFEAYFECDDRDLVQLKKDIREFAVKNLSVDSQNLKRISIWEQNVQLTR